MAKMMECAEALATYRKLQADLREVQSTAPGIGSNKAQAIMLEMADVWWSCDRETRDALEAEQFSGERTE